MKKIAFVLFSLLCVFISNAQNAGDIDQSFQTEGWFTETGTAKLIAYQPDGKILIAGSFDFYNGIASKKIIRLNSDGTVDPSFNVGADNVIPNFNNEILTIAVRQDGKIIIGGRFTVFNGITANRIVCLNSDGSVDNSFETESGFNNAVYAIKIQPDGKSIVAGAFTSYKGIACRKVIRLNTDGSVDASFDASEITNSIIAMALQPNGEIIVCSTTNIRRINSDGSIDPSFNSEIFLIGINKSIAIQPDGKIIIGDGAHVFRINYDGDTDFSFSIDNGSNKAIHAVCTMANGKIIVAGNFTTFNTQEANNIVCLNNDGTIDATFNSGIGLNNTVYALAVQADGQIGIGGNFSYYDQTTADTFIRIDANGNVDNSFTPATVEQKSALFTTTVQDDGKIIVGGVFNYYNATPANHILRFNNDGTVDSTFNTGSGFKSVRSSSSIIYNLILQPNGKIIAVGDFSEYNGIPVQDIVRLNQDGTLDSSFAFTPHNSEHFDSVTLQEDGKILAGGSTLIETAGILIRFNIDGTIDNTFNTGTGFNDEYLKMAVQPDGKIITSGAFSTYNDIVVNGVVRLNPDGTIDPSFALNAIESEILSLALLPNGKVLLSGRFTENGNTNYRILRLNADGTIDPGFTATFDNFALSMIAQSGDKLIAAGFGSYESMPAAYIVKLNSNGTVDASFNNNPGFSDYVFGMTQQNDGKIIAVGPFESYNNQQAKQIVRLHSDDVLRTASFSPESANTIFPNPVKDQLQLANNKNLKFLSYEIIDVMGKNIDSGNLFTSQIDVSGFAKGIYLLKLKTSAGESTHKFIKAY